MSDIGQFLQGHFLVAAHHLKDPNFFRTVVLLLEHNDDGAMGLVINRPSAMTIRKALTQSGDVNDADAPMFIGGPVETTSLFILHNCTSLASQDREVAPGVFLSGSETSFDTVVRTPPEVSKQPPRFRLLSGYAGWGPDQLESELARGDWYTLPADGALVLEDDPYGIWEICIRRIQRTMRIIRQEVRNPEWN